MRRKRENLGEAEVNLTPLIDVCFVVLIMFIVVAPILEMERVELASAPSSEQKSFRAVQEKSGIVIHVHADDTIVINQRKIWMALKGRLIHASKSRKQTTNLPR